MKQFTRRSFLKTTALTTAAVSLDALTWSRAAGANSDVRVAQIGFHSQGAAHLKALGRLKGVRVVALCDVDRRVLEGKVKEFGGRVSAYTDLRKLLENKEVDAVSIATPNHWHALATIWACQAGKDVYVEKPASHDLFEGRQMVEAARKYRRIVQCGMQCRSSAGVREAARYVRAGKLGKVVIARGFCYKGRKSIGLVDGPQAVPDYIDYDLWCGPAPKDPPRRNGSNGPVHYDWHWFWNYGNGDFGNQGPHQVDVCRWFLGEDAIAPFSMAVGGRLGYRDSAETPNTLIVYHGYRVPMVFEVRGLPETQAQQSGSWKMDRYKGVSIGNIIQCEHGYVVVEPDYQEAVIHDNDGKVMLRMNGRPDGAGAEGGNRPMGLTGDSGNHFGNWIAAVRSRKRAELNADIEEGHLSAGLVHTGNISFRLGARRSPGQIKEALQSDRSLAEAFDRMAGHLEANGVDLAKDLLELGAPLKFQPRQERFIGDAAANALARPDYRAPFTVPRKV